MADRLAELKAKYQPVFSAIEQQGVHLKNVHIENNKLLVRGEAPSQEAKNKVWDQIKQVDAQFADLTADISVSQSAAPAAGASPNTYTVQAGDTLSAISKRYYGDAGQYMKIFNANKDQLQDPNKIQPGQRLMIPPR